MILLAIWMLCYDVLLCWFIYLTKMLSSLVYYFLYCSNCILLSLD